MISGTWSCKSCHVNTVVPILHCCSSTCRAIIRIADLRWSCKVVNSAIHRSPLIKVLGWCIHLLHVLQYIIFKARYVCVRPRGVILCLRKGRIKSFFVDRSHDERTNLLQVMMFASSWVLYSCKQSFEKKLSVAICFCNFPFASFSISSWSCQ